MRFCDFYTGRGFLYIISLESSYCKRCIRVNRVCELAFSNAELDRLYKQNLKFREARAELAVKKTRFRK